MHAIGELNEVVHMMYRGRGSPAQMLQHGAELRLDFKKYVLNFGMSVKVTSMRAAKHRYESFARPSGRQCILVKALMKWMIGLLSRTGRLRRLAVRFLNWMSLKKWVLAAMLAEAQDELMVVIRFTDRLEYPLEQFASVLGNFYNRCYFLFGPARGALRPGSYALVVVTCRLTVDPNVG